METERWLLQERTQGSNRAPGVSPLSECPAGGAATAAAWVVALAIGGRAGKGCMRLTVAGRGGDPI